MDCKYANNAVLQLIQWKRIASREWNVSGLKNFIHKTLPFLAKVVLQDGVYWIHDYPNHPVSRLLLFVTATRSARAGRGPHPYVQFATSCREWAKQQQERLPENQLQQLHAATRDTVHILSNQVASLDQKVFWRQFWRMKRDGNNQK